MSDKWWEAAPLAPEAVPQAAPAPAAPQPAQGGDWWSAAPVAPAAPVEQPGMVTSAVRGVSQGLTLGAGDEGNAVGAASPIWGSEQRARVSPLPDPFDLLAGGARMILEKVAPGTFGKGGGDAYDRMLEQRRADDKQAKEANPISYGAGEIAGGVVPVVAAAGAAPMAFGLRGGLATRSLMSAASGAGVGAVQGFNTGEGGLEARGWEALKGFGGGAAIGAVAPGLGQVAGNVYQRIGDALVNRTATMPGYNSRAVQIVADVLDAQRAVKPNMQQDLAKLGPDAMLIDAGDTMKGLGQGVALRPGEARDRIVSALTDRKNAANGRIGEDLDNALGKASPPSQVEAELKAGRQAVGEGYKPALSEAGPIDTSTLANTLDTMAETLRGKPRDVVVEARQMLNRPGTKVLDNDPRAIHSVRKALDELEDTALGSETKSQIGFARQAVDDYLARAVPGDLAAGREGIKHVDARFQELSRQSEGLKQGSSILSNEKTTLWPQEMADAIKAGVQPEGLFIGPSGEIFRMRQGVRADMERIVGNHSNDYLAVKNMVKGEGDWNRSKLTQLFGEDQANQVINAVDREAAFKRVYDHVVEGSQTKMRDAAEELVKIRDGKGGEGAGVAALVGTVGGPKAVAGQAALKGAKAVKSVMDVTADQARNNDVARMLLMPASEISPVLDVLARNSRGRVAAETGGKATERIVQALLQSRGYDAGRLGAPYAQRFARSAF